jgi:CRISPR-associated protein Csx17
MEPLHLPGCRHDILGHYLKAIGLLRVLAKCAGEKHRDQDAEGWWDTDKACFCLRSTKYPTWEKLVEFFEQHYQPTPFFSPWNTGGGLDEKKEIAFSISQTSWQQFWTSNRDAVLPLVADEKKRSELSGEVLLGEKPLT